MTKKAHKFAHDNMLPKFTAEDMFKVLLTEHEITEEQRAQENIAVIDERLRYLGRFIGRELTDEEQLAILDIVDQYTPKDPDGNYLCSLLPFDYAWEIYKKKISKPYV